MAAAVFTTGTPSFMSTGATRAPVVRTAAVEDPVIIPGTIIITMRPRLSISGFLRNERMTHAARLSRSPVFWTDFMKIIAVAMISMVSR